MARKYARNMTDEEKKLESAHGLTYEQYDRLHHDQVHNKVNMVSANKDPDYKIPAHETHLYHLSLEAKLFDQATARKLSEPKFHKFQKRDYERMLKMQRFEGMELIIFHDPTRTSVEDHQELQQIQSKKPQVGRPKKQNI